MKDKNYYYIRVHYLERDTSDGIYSLNPDDYIYIDEDFCKFEYDYYKDNIENYCKFNYKDALKAIPDIEEGWNPGSKKEISIRPFEEIEKGVNNWKVTGGLF